MWSSGLGRWTSGYANGAAMYQLCGFKSRRGKNKNLTALKSNSNTVWFNFQTYIYIFASINEKKMEFNSRFYYLLEKWRKRQASIKVAKFSQPINNFIQVEVC